MQTFRNHLQLSPDLITARLAALDPQATCSFFRSVVRDTHEPDTILETQYYAVIETRLLDADVRDMLNYSEAVFDKWEVIRLQRNRLLTGSDWTQTLDAPLTPEEKQAWADYRQALRDIPQAFTDPDAVVFPTRPGEA